MKALKMILHVSEADRWHAALGNLANIVRHEPKPDTRVVVNGSAVYVLQGQHDWLAKMADLAQAGVNFQVCRNSLKAHDIDPTNLPEWAQVVPAGVIALAQAQAEGFAYIKP